MLTCGKRKSAITAQYAHGNGGTYRSLPIHAEKGNCAQKYLREDLLVSQLKEQLQSVALCDKWTQEILAQVQVWEKEQTHSSQTFTQHLHDKERNVQEKLDKLVSGYIDGEIPRESYLPKKEELLQQKISLTSQNSDVGQGGKNWIEPLRNWVLDIQQAEKLSQSDNFQEMKTFVQKIGTNHILLDRTISFSFSAPWGYISSRVAKRDHTLRGNSDEIVPENPASSDWWTWAELNRRDTWHFLIFSVCSFFGIRSTKQEEAKISYYG